MPFYAGCDRDVEERGLLEARESGKRRASRPRRGPNGDRQGSGRGHDQDGRRGGHLFLLKCGTGDPHLQGRLQAHYPPVSQ